MPSAYVPLVQVTTRLYVHFPHLHHGVGESPCEEGDGDLCAQGSAFCCVRPRRCQPLLRVTPQRACPEHLLCARRCAGGGGPGSERRRRLRVGTSMQEGSMERRQSLARGSVREPLLAGSVQPPVSKGRVEGSLGASGGEGAREEASVSRAWEREWGGGWEPADNGREVMRHWCWALWAADRTLVCVPSLLEDTGGF